MCASLTEDYERELVFDVIVTEALTGRAQNASASTTLHRHKYTLQLVKTAENFKPGLKYTAFVSGECRNAAFSQWNMRTLAVL